MPRRAALILTLFLPALPLSAQVNGMVRDSVSLLPITGARVTVQGTLTRTETGPGGSFVLPVPPGQVLVVVAARRGYYNRGVQVSSPANSLLLVLDPLPSGANPLYDLWPPEDCGFCHEQPYDEWWGSPMARAGTNRWVQDVYDGSGTPGGLGGFVYTRDSIHAATHPASECASCHQPEHWYDSPFSALLPGDLGTAFVVNGVGCEICHKIADVDTTRMSFPGLYPGVVEMFRPEPPLYRQVQFGLLGDVTFWLPGVMRASYQPQLAAEVCGTCHQDRNDPDGDGDFEEPDGVLSEATYGEWLASPYADPESPHHRSCVDCHMPPSTSDAVCIVLEPPIERAPGTLRSHDIRGTTPEFLENALSMSVEAISHGRLLEVAVAVSNDGAGHHVPTGVTVRNVILLVEANRAADGTPLAQVGGPLLPELAGIGDPNAGYFAGLPGKLYAKINHGPDGTGPVFYTEATGIIEDTRLPALSEDITRYWFQLPALETGISVRARLIYRRAWRALIDAKGWTEDGHGAPLADIAPPHFGHLMEEELLTISPPEGAARFLRGDVDGSGSIEITDLVELTAFLFQQGPVPGCRDAADADDSGRLDLADVLAVAHAVAGGSALPGGALPGGTAACAVDPTPDWLGCAVPGCP